MGNSFIGFPVPRAKIADMIAGAAPPIIHHTDHETGGGDEVDCTGLAGAGGITLPVDDFLYNAGFESLNGFYHATTGGGNISLDYLSVQLYTAGGIGDRVRLKRAPTYSSVTLSWDRNRSFSTEVAFSADVPANTRIVIGTGDLWSDKGFGFVVENGIFKAVSQVGATKEEHTIEDWSGGSFYNVRKLKVHKTGANEIMFYVDGSLVYTATETIPSGIVGGYEKILLKAEIRNIADGDGIGLYLSDFHFWQAAS